MHTAAIIAETQTGQNIRVVKTERLSAIGASAIGARISAAPAQNACIENAFLTALSSQAGDANVCSESGLHTMHTHLESEGICY